MPFNWPPSARRCLPRCLPVVDVVAGVLEVAEDGLQRARRHLGVEPLVVEEHVPVQAGEAARAHQVERQLAELGPEQRKGGPLGAFN